MPAGRPPRALRALGGAQPGVQRRTGRARDRRQLEHLRRRRREPRRTQFGIRRAAGRCGAGAACRRARPASDGPAVGRGRPRRNGRGRRARGRASSSGFEALRRDPGRRRGCIAAAAAPRDARPAVRWLEQGAACRVSLLAAVRQFRYRGDARVAGHGWRPAGGRRCSRSWIMVRSASCDSPPAGECPEHGAVRARSTSELAAARPAGRAARSCFRASPGCSPPAWTCARSPRRRPRCCDASSTSSSRLQETLARSPMPIVAAITGHCPAGGTVLALYCDYRIMARGAFRSGSTKCRSACIPAARSSALSSAWSAVAGRGAAAAR